jgi:hypothetical protein
MYASRTSSPTCACANCTTSSTPDDNLGGAVKARDEPFNGGASTSGASTVDRVPSAFSEINGLPSPI